MRVAVRLALGMLPLVSFAVSICSFWKLSNLNRGSRQAAVGTRKIFPAKLNWGTHHFGPQPLSTNDQDSPHVRFLAQVDIPLCRI